MTALDLGCGPGFFSVEMAIMVGEYGLVIATDLQEGLLQKLKNKIHIKTKWESSYCRTKTISRFKGGV
nr:hypothetical protein BSM_21070 [uncultured archaeon]